MPAKMLLILLYSIFNDIIAENFIVASYNSTPYLTFYWAFIFTVGFAFLQFFSSPIQSGLSDIIGRKKSMLFATSISLISLLLLSLNFLKLSKPMLILLILGFIKGSMGNITPIALGGIYDNQKGAFRPSFAWATSSWAFAYAALAFFSYYFKDNFIQTSIYSVLIGFNIIIILTIYKERKSFSPDILEIKHGKAKKIKKNIFLDTFEETRFSLKDAKNKYIRMTLSPYFLWELSLYLLVVYLTDYSQIKSSKLIILALMLGYLLGICILILCKMVKDVTIIKWGYCISFLSLLPYFVLYKFVNHNVLLTFCYFLHTIGNALLCPTLLTLLAKERPRHKQGRSYGLADSTDTMAYLCANIIILIIKELKLGELFIVIISFASFSISWLFYRRFLNDSKFPKFCEG